ncbi:MAG TPA: AsmA-like C-terminal region-containing protein, partial [Anaeromyxobacteraceae bacterium]|nr:AsmA-like C-terminal region-containing protein [Anaeromyxobacteraceae bacterium]
VSGKAQKLELASLSLALLDTNVKAHGTTELAPGSTRFDLAAEIDRVDVDRLLMPSGPAKDASPAAKGSPAAGKKAAAAKAGPPAAREAAAPEKPAAKKAKSGSVYAGIAGKASLRIGQVIAQKQKMTDVRVAVAMKEDEVTVQEGRLGLWEGVLSVAGTRARLAPADMPFDLVAKMERVSVESALAAFTDKKVLSGRLDADVKLSGKGEDAEKIKKALGGTIEGKLLDGQFHGKDLIGEVTGPIVKAIPALRTKVTTGGTTRLGKVLPVSLRVHDGKADFQKPLEFEDRGATIKAQGGFTLDGEMDMPVTLTLSPAAATDLTGGKAKMDEPLPFGFKLVGKAWSPRPAGLDVMPAVKVIGAKLATAAVGKALGAPAEAAKEKAAEKVQDATKALQEGAAKKLKGLFGR